MISLILHAIIWAVFIIASVVVIPSLAVFGFIWLMIKLDDWIK